MVPQAAVPGVLVGMLGRFREFALAHTHLQGLVLEYQVPRVRYGGNIIIRVDKLYTGDTVNKDVPTVLYISAHCTFPTSLVKGPQAELSAQLDSP